MIYGIHSSPIVNKGDAAAARKTLECALESKGDFPDFYFQIAKTYIVEGNLDAAQKELQKALEKNSNYFEALLLSTRLLLDMGNVEKAYHAIQPVRAKYDTYADVSFTYGLILYMQGNYADALTEARRAYELNPKYRDAHLLELVIFRKAGRIEEFSRKRSQVDEVDPGAVADKCFYHGLRFFEQAQYASSIYYFDAATVVGAEKWDCQFNIACAYAKMQWITDAHEMFKNILSYEEKFKQHIIDDPDLEGYRSTEYFAALNL